VDSKPYTTDSVISKDGTKIGYRQLGNGPAVILAHGSLMASQDFMKLAVALSGEFTVYIPDRRGRGLSGPYGDNYGLAKECEDMQALIYKAGAQNIFGLSSGAIIALHTAFTTPAIRKVALYEPPFSIPGTASPLATNWLLRYEKELSQGKPGAALVSILKGVADPSLFLMLPRFILVPRMTRAIEAQAKMDTGDEVPVKALIPTMHYDIKLVKETEGKIDIYKTIQAKVLLLGGSKSAGYLKAALNALKKILPDAGFIKFPGLGHTAADNGGKPEIVAQELRKFFIEKPISQG